MSFHRLGRLVDFKDAKMARAINRAANLTSADRCWPRCSGMARPEVIGVMYDSLLLLSEVRLRPASRGSGRRLEPDGLDMGATSAGSEPHAAQFLRRDCAFLVVGVHPID